MLGLTGGKTGEGKSKMLFFQSYDKRFVCKTVKRGELDYFRKISENLYYHYISNPSTLLCRFYGLYRISIPRNTAGRIRCGTVSRALVRRR